MKKELLIKTIVIIAIAFLATRICPAQETTYLSNLGQSPAGALGIGNNSWWAAGIVTGTNSGGYLLDSIQLFMANDYSAGGSPNNFTIMLYATAPDGFHLPENNIATLEGSANPATAGVYTYTAGSSLMLSPDIFYSIVLTSGTPFIAPEYASVGPPPSGYLWNFSNSTNPYVYNPSGGWFSPYTYRSTNGINWSFDQGLFPQFSITVEPVPEPGILNLSIVASLLFALHRRKQAMRSGVFLFRIFVGKKNLWKRFFDLLCRDATNLCNIQ
jgi:hypothetical protein